MKTANYSSLAAFLAHYRVLRRDHARSTADAERLAAMEQLLDMLRPEEREAIESDSEAPAVTRHRERAELKLGRALLARGVIHG